MYEADGMASTRSIGLKIGAGVVAGAGVVVGNATAGLYGAIGAAGVAIGAILASTTAASVPGAYTPDVKPP